MGVQAVQKEESKNYGSCTVTGESNKKPGKEPGLMIILVVG
ncbi:hypothetical protein ABIA96_005167 [Bradyrhizobium sp. LB11.1]